MKIMIIGYSGSGKSTLCRKLAQKYELPFLNLDRVEYLPNWETRPADEQQQLVTEFMDRNREGWVIDGNYRKLSYERRLEEADQIILMLFGRFNCLYRCFRRYRTFRGTSRPDMTDGCNEKLDWEFARWILWEGRSKGTRERYRTIQKKYPEKATVLRNQRDLDKFLAAVKA